MVKSADDFCDSVVMPFAGPFSFICSLLKIWWINESGRLRKMGLI